MGNDNIQRMSPAELREACYCAAATATISYALGYGYVDAVVDDDGFGWPTRSSDVETAPWPIGDDPAPYGKGEPSADTAYQHIASRRAEGREGYKVELAHDQDAFPAPNWPKQSFSSLIQAAFSPDRIIDRDDHPALLRLIGAKQQLG